MFTSRFFNILSTLSLYFLISTLLATPRKMVPEISWRWGTWQLAHFNINEVNFGGIPIGILQLSLSSSWRRMWGTNFDSPGSIHLYVNCGSHALLHWSVVHLTWDCLDLTVPTCKADFAWQASIPSSLKSCVCTSSIKLRPWVHSSA